MLTRSLHILWTALALLLVLPQVGTAQNWRVTDTFTQEVIVPGDGFSTFEDVAPPFYAQRVFQIDRIGTTLQWPYPLGSCSITGSTDIVISQQPSPNVWPGGTTIVLRHITNNIGTHQATVTCPSAFQFTVRGRMLDPNPNLLLETAQGVFYDRNSSFPFGSVASGASKEQEFRIVNFGNQALTVGSQLIGAAFSFVTSPPSSIPKGGEALFRIRFSGVGSGSTSGELRLTGNDPQGLYKIYLNGTVTASVTPQIRITDNGNGGAVVAKGSTVNVGTTTPKSPLTRTFTVANVGSGTLTLTNPSSLLVSSPGWTLLSGPTSTSLGANQSTTFTVRFDGGSSGTYFGTVSIASNDPDDNPFSYTLQGQVASAAPRLRVVSETTNSTMSSGGTASFGSPQQGSLAYHSFQIWNDGTAPLQLSGTPTLSGPGYTFQDQPSLTVLPNSWTRVSVLFQSNNLGTNPGTLSIGHNDSTSANPFVINLTANVVMPALPVVSLTATDTETSESSNSGQYRITRSGITAAALAVNVTVSGSAQNGSDFQTISSSYTIPIGQSSVNVPLLPIDDSLIEDVETVTLSVATGSGYVIGSPNAATIELTNNDYTPCVPAASRLCLQNGRFEVTLVGFVGSTQYNGQAVPLPGGATGAFWLFSSNNLEVAVKVLDGSGTNGKYWVYHGGATDLAYTLTVKDLANASRQKIYNKAAGNYCGGGDAFAFLKSSPLSLSEKDDLEALEEIQPYTKAFTCTPDSTTACLLGNRFRVRVKQGTTYRSLFHTTADTGFFWFYSPENMEVFVKLLDATALPGGHYWVFYGSLTDQPYTIEVTDTHSTESPEPTNFYSGTGPLCGGSDLAAF